MPIHNKEERDELCKAKNTQSEDTSLSDALLKTFMAKMPKYSSADPLTSFLYLLMRDHLPVGTVVKLIADSSTGESCIFTNGHLAQFAAFCSDEMQRNIMRSNK